LSKLKRFYVQRAPFFPFKIHLLKVFYFLQVPPGNNVASQYRLRVEGAGIGGGAIIFENETILEFSQQFLSVSISTNKAIFTGYQQVRNTFFQEYLIVIFMELLFFFTF